MSGVLIDTGIAILACVVVGRIAGRITRRRALAAEIASDVLLLAGSVLAGDRIAAGLWSACLAIDIHRWWRNGGGNGTKRRFRRLRERFTSVRRTAPAAAMAVAQ